MTYEDLRRLKSSKQWWDVVVTAITKKDFEMKVWNGIHPVEENTTTHICKAGTRVRVWMVSRFGDAGITDNLKNPKGYDCRGVDVDKDLEDIEIQNVPLTEEERIENKGW